MVGVAKRTPKSMGGRLLLDSTHRASMRGLLQRARHLHSFSVVGMATHFPLMHEAFQTRLPNISWFGYGGGIPSRNLGHGHALVFVIRGRFADEDRVPWFHVEKSFHHGYVHLNCGGLGFGI